MNDNTPDGLSRRELMRKTGEVALVSALAGVALPQVHAGEDNTIRIALVGCGGRGTGAIANALSTKNGPTKLVAMADVFADRLSKSYQQTREVVPQAGRRSRKAQVHRLRCLQEGDGLPAARRRSDPDDAAGIPLGPLYLRDPEGPQRLHGEAGHRGRAEHAEDAQARRRVPGTKPESRRRPHVPALRRPARALRSHQVRAPWATFSCFRPIA